MTVAQRNAIQGVRRIAATMIVCSAMLAHAASKPLTVYFIDVEGGQATLIVSPSGESMLVDTGYVGFEDRDAERIAATVREAGLKRIDHVFITHYHADHVGGVPALLQRVKVGTFYDHGANREDTQQVRALYDAYAKAIGETKHVVVKPGDRVPLKGTAIEVVAAGGEHIAAALDGAGQANSNCADEPTPASDPTENAQSAGFLLTFGKFRFLDLGDLTKQNELHLVCPKNLIGGVDVYLTTHHGLDLSNTKSLVYAVRPRVAIMNNGAKKGGVPAAWQIVHDSPGLEDFWQLHYSLAGGEAHNVAEKYIANPGDTDEGKNLKLTADRDGSFQVTNLRNGFSKAYPVKAKAASQSK